MKRSEFYVDDLSFDGEFIAEFLCRSRPLPNEVNRGACDSTRFLEQRFHLHLIGLLGCCLSEAEIRDLLPSVNTVFEKQYEAGKNRNTTRIAQQSIDSLARQKPVQQKC